MNAADRDKLRKCFNLLSSNHDGEVLGAARAIIRVMDGQRFSAIFEDIDKLKEAVRARQQTIQIQDQEMRKLNSELAAYRAYYARMKSKPKLIRKLIGI